MSSSSTSRKILEQQSTFTREATILRKKLQEWDYMLRNPRGEDWPTMLGRLNAALSQTTNLDKSIEDVLEHFVYVPRQSTANAQDIPFFLSTRLQTPSDETTSTAPTTKKTKKTTLTGEGSPGDDDPLQFLDDPAQQLVKFESIASNLATAYEESMIRF